MAFLKSKQYTPISTPLFISEEYMRKTCQLSDFKENLYQIGQEEDQSKLFLIATSEQPLSCYYANEVFLEKELNEPIKFAGHSQCFRKEAGAHGKEAWGLYRTH